MSTPNTHDGLDSHDGDASNEYAPQIVHADEGDPSDGSSLDEEVNLRSLLNDARDRGAEAEVEGTRREYRRAMESFEDFCRAIELDPMHESTKKIAAGLVAYIEQLAQDGYAASTISKRLTGIRHFYKKSGRESPTKHRSVRRAMQNVKKTVSDDRGYGQKLPVLIEDLQQMEFDTSRLLDLRDRAIMFVGFAGGLRRSEIVGLERRDLRDVKGGVAYRIRDPKTSDDPQTVHVPDEVPALDPGPNQSLWTWLEAAEISSGPLFRRVDDRGGSVSDTGSHPDTIYRVVRRWVASIGEDPDEYGSHSLRAGFVTQAHLDRIPDQEAATQTRHEQITTLHEYQRTHAVPTEHPLTRMGTGESSSDG